MFTSFAVQANCFDGCERDYHLCAADRVQVPEVCQGSRKICVERCDPAAKSLKALSHRQSGPTTPPRLKAKKNPRQICIARCDGLAFNCAETNGEGPMCDNTRQNCLQRCPE